MSKPTGPCFKDKDGKLQDKGLHRLEPADPERYRLSGIKTARSIGIPEAAIEAIYGKAPK